MWPLPLTGEHKLLAFKKTYGPWTTEICCFVLFLKSVTLGHSHYGKNTGWGRYLDQRGVWRKLHNDELHCLYSSSWASLSVFLIMSFTVCIPHQTSFGWSHQGWGMWHIRDRGEIHTEVRLEKLNIPLERPRHRRQNNMKHDLKETVWNTMVWINLPQDRDQWQALVNMVMNLQVP
jgi:hypothetical protein